MPNTDDAKGRVKEAAGDLTNNEDLKNEGKVDRAAGGVKDKVEGAVDAVKDKLHKD
ncbi:MAG: CsbD family protein [Actinomycetota bacterium]|nr:CsbD family protein [Actinomycetota bacterium]